MDGTIEKVDEGSGFTSGPERAIIPPDWAASAVERQEDVKHPPAVWSDAAYSGQSLTQLSLYYVEYLKGRASPASEGTIDKYRKTLLSFIRFLQKRQEPLTLSSLTPHNVNGWVAEQRRAGLSEDGIASRLAALKAFAHKYVYKEVQLTTCDLLERVARINPPAKPFPRLSDAEQAAVLECYQGESYTDIRDQALVACYLATGKRFREILSLKVADLNPISGEIRVRVKGGDEQLAVISPGALKLVKRYLRVRSAFQTATDSLWLTDEGKPISYWGGMAVFRRLKQKSGVKRIHAHLFRHTFAQVALEKGAERATVQDMLGHKSDLMSRRYAGAVRQQTAARLMPKYAPI